MREHVVSAKRGSQAPIHCAIREWGIETFTPAVLQNCYSQSELDTYEGWWIDYCNTRDECVGYNVTAVRARSEKQMAQANMSDEDRRRFKEYGLRAIKARPREFYIECGRKAGLLSKKKAVERKQLKKKEQQNVQGTSARQL